MQTISFTVSDEHAARLVNAFGADYKNTLEDGTANPQTKAAFAKAQLDQYIKNYVLNFEKAEAAKAVQEITVS